LLRRPTNEGQARLQGSQKVPSNCVDIKAYFSTVREVSESLAKTTKEEDKMKAAVNDFFNDSERDEQESSEDTAWGDNFIQIRGIWYGKREEIHTRCNTCEAHTDQIIYQNEDDEKYIYLCSCWTDTNMERDPRAVIQLRT